MEQLKINNLLSGKNPIKKTPKGYRYKFFHVKRRNKDTKKFNGRGFVFFFYDFGDKACFNNFKYDSNGDGKFSPQNNNKTWIKITGDRIQFSNSSGNRNDATNQYKIISNQPSFNFAAGGRKNKADEKFKKIFIKWVEKNGIKVKRKFRSLPLHNLCLFLSYPELEYIYDFKNDKKSFFYIPSIISSRIHGVKGINHIFDRFCGFHGKSLKKELQSNDNILAALAACKIFKGLISNDDMKYVFDINSKLFIKLTNRIYKSYRYFLKNYSRETIVNWLKSDRLSLLHDTVNQYYENHIRYPNNRIVLPNSNNLEEIHNIVSRNNRRIIENRTSNTDFTEINKKYSNFEFKTTNFEVVLPKNGQELIDTSYELSNCLSGYIDFHGKHGLILIVKSNNITKYAISINFPNTLQQFYGGYNKIPKLEDYNEVVGILRKQCNIDTSYFDGVVIKI